LRVIRNDEFEPATLLAENPSAIVISPGPGTPARAGRCIELIRANEHIPLLGVCLGHQAIAEAFGATVLRGDLPVHGKVSEVRHRDANLFAGCPHPMRTARYHSLVVARETLPDFLEVDAETDDGAIMALSHKERPVFGIQFHPESYGTESGDQLIENFLLRCHPERSRGIPLEQARATPSAGDPLTALGMTQGIDAVRAEGRR
ncbi:MAG TPA: aminodeoxychorismate/anthranilate synthase component II, partial [Thermoanaerobaculia bacterium]